MAIRVIAIIILLVIIQDIHLYISGFLIKNIMYNINESRDKWTLVSDFMSMDPVKL